MPRRRQCVPAFLLVPLWLVAAACGRSVVVTDLAPEEAQRCAVVLKAEGLDAVVGPDDGGDGARRQVTIGGDSAALRGAIEMLEAHGLPRRTAAGFVVESSSLIPTASEERARYLKGLSGEIETLLECVDGVESAEALVSLPERRPLAQVGAGASSGEATASVVISHMGDTSPVTEPEVRAVVVRAVGAAMTPESVSVLMKPIVRRRPPSSTVRVERDGVTEAGFVLSTCVLAAAQALTVWRMRALRRSARREERNHVD
jgi:type III secretion protein J